MSNIDPVVADAESEMDRRELVREERELDIKWEMDSFRLQMLERGGPEKFIYDWANDPYEELAEFYCLAILWERHPAKLGDMILTMVRNAMYRAAQIKVEKKA